MVKQVLNYHDVQLYDTDIALFENCQWLNDNAINFYFTYLYHTVCAVPSQAAAGRPGDVLLMDPAVVSCLMLQCDDDDEYAELGYGLQISNKKLCLIPVNDNQSFDSDSSHWSLLVYADQRFVHYDSSAGHNTSAAKRIARTFLQLLRATSGGIDNVPVWNANELFVNARDAPQQTNGYDCGMYVLVVAEFLMRRYCEQHREDTMATARVTIQEYTTPARVTQLRLAIPEIVKRLQQESQPSTAQ